MAAFLDINILNDFHSTFDGSKIFSHDDMYKHECFNLFCAITHRITTCVNYLNLHSHYPETEEDYINFLTFSDMIVEGIKVVFSKLKIENPFDNVDCDNSYQYFKDAIIDSPKAYECKINELDTKFFKYIRALALAHSFGTDQHRGFLLKGEIQYSPFVLANNPGTFFRNISNPVGLKVYSNKQDNQFSIIFSFENLKKFICSRYELLTLATKKLLDIINIQKSKWLQVKVNRNQSFSDILYEIKQILESRFESTHEIDNIISYYTLNITENQNCASVKRYREAIEQTAPKVCDSIDSLNYENMYNSLSILFDSPKKAHKELHYQREKIFTYLHSTSDEYNIEWGLKQADKFAQSFAKKWVVIKIETMSFEEIKLLVQTACYLEKIEQEENND